jgi:hypothetical protein
MRAYASLVLCLTVSLLAATAPAAEPTSPVIDPQAIIKSYLEEDEDEPIEFRSFSPAVKTSTCRMYNRSKGTWEAVQQGIIAVHVRYRKAKAYGKPVKSEVFFLDADSTILKIAEASAVRCSDPALLK